MVFVNLSDYSLREAGDLERQVRGVLQRSGLEGYRLGLEISERAVMSHAGPSADALKRLRDLGASVVLDDFGTGYSSLSRLSALPTDYLKLDKSFVRDAVGDAQSSAITTAIIALGHSLGLTVVAEGVETPAQLAYLAERSGDVVQGYLFGRPVPAAEAAALFAAGVTQPA